jgi:hypothetical protein
VSQYLIEYLLLLYASDNFDRASAFATNLYLNLEDTLESLGPGHRRVTLGG